MSTCWDKTTFSTADSKNQGVRKKQEKVWPYNISITELFSKSKEESSKYDSNF